MKTRKMIAILGISTFILAGGCTRVVYVQKPVKPVMVKKSKPEFIKITGIGYGSTNNYELYTPAQRRLMAIRASKLDAYRSLAEQIYGVKIDSNTTVSALVAKSDSFRARVNALVRGARVVSVTPMADGNYETVLEVYVDKAFFKKQMVYSGKGYEDDNGQSVCDVAVSGAECLKEDYVVSYRPVVTKQVVLPECQIGLPSCSVISY